LGCQILDLAWFGRRPAVASAAVIRAVASPASRRLLQKAV
jgi:hypothetical protein